MATSELLEPFRSKSIFINRYEVRIMAQMMWAGRSSKEVDSKVNDFNSSISFDGRMYRHDIEGSIAHATMLGEQGIISMEDSLTLIGGLKEILADIDSGALELDMTAEDIHMFIEAELTKRLGDVGKRLHMLYCLSFLHRQHQLQRFSLSL